MRYVDHEGHITDFRYRIVKCGKDGWYAEDASIGYDATGRPLTGVKPTRRDVKEHMDDSAYDGYTLVK